jgi:hypothetical protein
VQLLVGLAHRLDVHVGGRHVDHRLPQPRHPLGQLAADRLGNRHRLVHVAQQLAGAVQERLAGDAQRHPAGGAPQELAADELLQRADLPAEGGLGDVEPLRGPAEAQLLGDGHERAQVPQLDRVRRLGDGEHSAAVLVHAADYPGTRQTGSCRSCMTVMRDRPFPFRGGAASIPAVMQRMANLQLRGRSRPPQLVAAGDPPAGAADVPARRLGPATVSSLTAPPGRSSGFPIYTPQPKEVRLCATRSTKPIPPCVDSSLAASGCTRNGPPVTDYSGRGEAPGE